MRSWRHIRRGPRGMPRVSDIADCTGMASPNSTSRLRPLMQQREELAEAPANVPVLGDQQPEPRALTIRARGPRTG